MTEIDYMRLKHLKIARFELFFEGWRETPGSVCNFSNSCRADYNVQIIFARREKYGSKSENQNQVEGL